MVRFFLRLYDFFQDRRRLCMALLTAMVGVLLAMMSTLKYNENIYDFLPLSGDDQKAINIYQDISGGQRIVAMFSKAAGDSIDTDRLARAVDFFAEKVRTGSGRRHISQVTSQVDFEKYAGLTDFVYANMPVMLTDSDYIRMEHALAEPDYAGEQLARDMQMVMMPATGIFTTNIGNDPLQLFTPVLERLQTEQRSMPFEIDNGYIFTSDRKYALVMITSPYGAMESAKNAELVSHVDSVARQTMAQMKDVEIDLTGAPVIAVGNARQIKTDSVWAISIAVTLILLLLIFSFRNMKGMALVGFAIVFGWLFAMGAIAVVSDKVSLIVLGIGSIIIGITVNYPLHFVLHASHGTSAREILKDMVEPLLIGNITTVGAFAALLPLDAPALRDLGFFAAFMLIGTILFVLIFLPHMVKATGGQKEERLFFGRLAEMSSDRHQWVLWVILLPTIILAWFSLKTSFDSNMHHINYMSTKQEQLLSDLHAAVGINDTATIYVVTEGKTWDEALARRQHVADKLETMKHNGEVKTFSDVTSFIPSEKEQQRRIHLWNDFWTRHSTQVKEMLAHESPLYGFSADAFQGFEAIISKPYVPHDFSHFEPLRSTLLSGSFSTSTGACAVVDKVSATPKTNIAKVEERLEGSLGSRGFAFDFMGMNSAVANSLSDNFNYIGFACSFIVFIFLWLSFGRLELSLLAFLPMALGWIWILGIMYICGMQFNIVNIILATFIFGQGDDYTIFMTDGLINEYGYRKKLLPSFKNSIAISALIMFIGMGSLIVARHPALHSLAEVTIVGMTTVVLMAWVVPPLVFGWIVRTDGHQRQFPVTIEQIVRTTYCAIVYLFELSLGCFLGMMGRLLPVNKTKIEDWMHRFIWRVMKVNITHIQGIKSVIHNPYQETFSRGSILISNHQSILDPIYMLALHPKVLVCISGRVWRNPIVHGMFRVAGFICLDQPMKSLQAEIGRAVDKGYNIVIFPEGRRTDGPIARFHRGAFSMAQQLNADILPVYIHGIADIMPKGSGFAARGQIDIEIGKRVTASEHAAFGNTYQQITHHFHEHYIEHYEQLCCKIENTHYFHHHVIYKYMYKGIEIERETKRLFKQYDDFSQWIDGLNNEERAVSVINARHGQFSLLMALVHPQLQIYSYVYDADDAALASTCEPLPKNLHIILSTDEAEAIATASNTHIINLSKIY